MSLRAHTTNFPRLHQGLRVISCCPYHKYVLYNAYTKFTSLFFQGPFNAYPSSYSNFVLIYLSINSRHKFSTSNRTLGIPLLQCYLHKKSSSSFILNHTPSIINILSLRFDLVVELNIITKNTIFTYQHFLIYNTTIRPTLQGFIKP